MNEMSQCVFCEMLNDNILYIEINKRLESDNSTLITKTSPSYIDNSSLHTKVKGSVCKTCLLKKKRSAFRSLAKVTLFSIVGYALAWVIIFYTSGALSEFTLSQVSIAMIFFIFGGIYLFIKQIKLLITKELNYYLFSFQASFIISGKKYDSLQDRKYRIIDETVFSNNQFVSTNDKTYKSIPSEIWD